MHNRGLILTSETTLSDMQKAGAERLADVPIDELLEFVRNQLLRASEAFDSDEEKTAAEECANAAGSVQQAIESYRRAILDVIL